MLAHDLLALRRGLTMTEANAYQVELVDRALAALATTEGKQRLRQHFAGSNDGATRSGGVGLDDLTLAFVELRRRALRP